MNKEPKTIKSDRKFLIAGEGNYLYRLKSWGWRNRVRIYRAKQVLMMSIVMPGVAGLDNGVSDNLRDRVVLSLAMAFVSWGGKPNVNQIASEQLSGGE